VPAEPEGLSDPEVGLSGDILVKRLTSYKLPKS
jgi:hypothetical protein